MRHKIDKHNFGGRKQGPKKALLRGLVDSLVEYGRIQTTLTKAKVVRSLIEKAVTRGKDDGVHSFRVLSKKYPNKKTVKSIVKDISPRFKDRNGGYTRIVKTGHRQGDGAEMAYLEFVDYILPEAKTDETFTVDKEAVKRERRAAKRVATAKKSRRRMQSSSRQRNR